MPKFQATRNALGGIRITIDLDPKEALASVQAAVAFSVEKADEVKLPWPAIGAFKHFAPFDRDTRALAEYLTEWLASGNALASTLSVTIQKQLAAQAGRPPAGPQDVPG